ncbi:MAG: hypothetical protein LBG61_04665 [Burkholderiales bacterium]|jgi:hypothetical protein|nr:hypothetical protein [Burkholderiales bacterium]
MNENDLSGYSNPKPPLSPTIALLPFKSGNTWWRHAYQLFRAFPARWLAIGVSFFLLTNVSLLILDLIGLGFFGVFLSLILPCFIAGLISCAWSQLQNTPPSIHQLLNGFKANTRALIGIGASCFLVMIVLFVLVGVIAGRLGIPLQEFMNTIAEANFDKTQLSAFYQEHLWQILTIFSIVALVASVVGMVEWFATMVVVFLNQGMVLSMVLATKALFKNWRAFLVWGLMPVIAFVGFEIVMMMLLAVAALLGGAAVTLLTAIGVIAFVVVMFLTLSIGMPLSLFVAYCDMFHHDEKVF